jgi:hypothetical protein
MTPHSTGAQPEQPAKAQQADRKAAGTVALEAVEPIKRARLRQMATEAMEAQVTRVRFQDRPLHTQEVVVVEHLQ